MIPLHCLWAKSNNRTRDQFEYDVTWFCFELVCPHAQCGCWSIVFWRGWGRWRERDSFKIGPPRSWGWTNFGRRRTRGVRVLKITQFSWTLYVYCP